MYIEQIILEGFKTYMNRTVITRFDPQFNAITGYNGSGKSNILDAIQFLLGSTSKDMLRLKTGLTELIYKEGFAGIDKASVTIKFRCLQKSARPTGYEGQQQLVVTRQITKDKITKLFINGTSSNLTKVKNLFRSVQLNIENPHFLVKQGQITKIINFKPNELLGMIEETAGTAYYKKTKLESERLIEKKQQKLNSINQILISSIQPQMQKLQADRRKYAAFKDKEGQMKHLNQKIHIYEYNTYQNSLKKSELEQAALRENLQAKNEALAECVRRLNELDEQIKMLKSKGSNQVTGQFNKMKNLLAQKNNERAQIKERLQKIHSEIITLKQEAQKQSDQLDKRRKDIEWYSKQNIQTQKKIEETDGLLNQLKTLKSQENPQLLIDKQIRQEEAQLHHIALQLKGMAAKREMLCSEVTNDKKQKAQLQTNAETMKATLKQLQAEISISEKLKQPLPVEDPELASTTLQNLQNERRRTIKECYQLAFDFINPQGPFDRSKVKGKLFMLFRLKDRVHEKALEIGAGGKLFNIVVSDEIASKQLVDQECFGKNVTVMPNNKIRYKPLRQEVIRQAAAVAKQLGGLAKPAYDLITYSKELQNSIMFAFSGFIVCSNSQIAQKIAFNHNKSLSCRCVTYDGDIFESGTLTGGYVNKGNLVLEKYYELCQIDAKLQMQRKKVEGQRDEYNRYQREYNQYKLKQKELQVKMIRRDKLKQKIMNMSLEVTKKDYGEEIKDIEDRMRQLQNESKQLNKKINQLKAKGQNGEKSVDYTRKQLEGEIKKYREKLVQSKKFISHIEVQTQLINRKVNRALNNEKELQQQTSELVKEQRELLKDINTYRVEYQRLQEEKKRSDKQVAINQANLQVLYNELNEMKNHYSKSELQKEQMEHRLNVLSKQQKQNQQAIREITKLHPWLVESREELEDNFNYEQTLRDYKLASLEVDKLKKTAKMNIDEHSYQKLYDQYKSLQDKRSTLEKDKLTILNNMHDLDDKRNKTLERCFASVQINLANIFNDLLPGATAHLNLIDPRDITNGAQLQVSFNHVIKELSELSGGQRSLLALSFILALLLYKPSPFYILDEIDAALDLSHTENIGYMISQRFPQSQFIIISLKEGMFQNANVLYRVQFTEGQSKVERQPLKKKL